MANEIGSLVTKFAKTERGLIAGILFYATIGFRILPNHDTVDADDSIFDETQDFSSVPKWKKVLSLVILIVTLVGMIFEEEIGVNLCITGCVGALLLILTGVISEKDALKSIDLKTIFLFGGTLSLAKALEVTGAGEMIADKVIGGSCAYATPIGMPANTMVVGAGNYKFIDYVKAGLPLIAIATVISMIVLPIAFPFYP